MSSNNVKILYEGKVYYISKLHRLCEGHLVVCSLSSPNSVKCNRVFYVAADTRRKVIYNIKNGHYTIVTRLGSFFGEPADTHKMMKSIYENMMWEEGVYERMKTNPFAIQRHKEIIEIMSKVDNTPSLSIAKVG